MFQYSTDLRNALADRIESFIGASAVLKIKSGAAPANVAASRTGTVLATIQLPADWASNAVNGTLAKLGVWEDVSADAAGTAGHFELCASDATTVHLQGSVTATGGGGDMTIDNTNIAAGQKITVTNFDQTVGGA